MKLEAIVLTNFDNRKIFLYDTLCTLTEKNHSINYLHSITQYSNKNIRSLLQSIENDLIDFFGLSKLFVDDVFAITYPLPPSNAYKEELISHSFPTKIICSIVFQPHKNLQNLTLESFMSLSTAIRRIGPLKQYFNELGIHFCTTTLSLTGDERIIRICLAQLLWLTNPNINFPITFEDKNLYNEYQLYKNIFFNNSITFPMANQIDLLLTVFYFRTVHGFFITENMPEIFKDWFSHEYPDFSYKKLFSLLSENEILFLLYTPYYSPIDFNESEKRGLFITNLLQKEENLFIRFVHIFKKFYLSFITSSQLTKRKQDLLDQNALYIIFLYSIFQQRVPTLLDLTDTTTLEQNSDYVDLKIKVGKFVYNLERRKDFMFLKNSREQVIYTIAALLLPEYSLSLHKKNLSVLLIIEMNYLFSQPVIQFLTELTFVHLHLSTEKFSVEPDFIIASSSKSAKIFPEKECYIIQSYYVNSDFIDLYGTLKRAHFKKNKTNCTKNEKKIG